MKNTRVWPKNNYWSGHGKICQDCQQDAPTSKYIIDNKTGKHALMDGAKPSNLQHSFVCPYTYGPNRIRNNRYTWFKNNKAYPPEWALQNAQYEKELKTNPEALPPTSASVYQALLSKGLIKEIEKAEEAYMVTGIDDDFLLEELDKQKDQEKEEVGRKMVQEMEQEEKQKVLSSGDINEMAIMLNAFYKYTTAEYLHTVAKETKEHIEALVKAGKYKTFMEASYAIYRELQIRFGNGDLNVDLAWVFAKACEGVSFKDIYHSFTKLEQR